MSKIVALRGLDGGCGCSGARSVGDDASAMASAVVTDPKMSTTTMLVWAGVLATAGYIFWGTLQPPKRKRAA